MLNLVPPSTVDLFVSQQKKSVYDGYVGMLCLYMEINNLAIKKQQLTIINNLSLVSNEIICLLGLNLIFSSFV